MPSVTNCPNPQPPLDVGVLNFHDTSTAILNATTSSKIHHHGNQTPCPKVLTPSGQFLLVTKSDTTERAQATKVSPGTILEVTDNTLLVTTSTDLILLSAAELDGRDIPPEMYRVYGLIPGSCLQSIQSSSETDFVADFRKYEDFWTHELQRYEPTTVTRHKLLRRFSDISGGSETRVIHCTTLKLPAGAVQSAALKLPAVDVRQEVRPECVSLTSFITFIARICCSDVVHIGLVANKKDIPLQFQSLYSDVCPGIFELNLHSPRQVVFQKCCEDLEKNFSAGTFLKEVFFRCADLRKRSGEIRHNMVVGSVGNIQETGDIPVKDILADSNVLVLLNSEEMKILYMARRDQSYGPRINMLSYYPAYLSSLCSLSSTDSLLEVQLLSQDELVMLYPQSEPLPEQPDLFSLFFSQVRKSPNAVALKTTRGHVTYHETLEAVNKLVKLLGQHLPESYKVRKRCVGLHLPKSMAYVLCTLACVRVGCPFLPLPVDLPEDRLAFTLQDADVSIMITNDLISSTPEFQSLLSNPRVLFSATIVDLNLVMLKLGAEEKLKIQGAESAAISEKCSRNSRRGSGRKNVSMDEDCCYVIYTSGSTGRPKGVQVKRSGVVNMAKALIYDLDLQPTDITAQFASIGFDTSIWEIFPSLLSGGMLAVLQDNERLGKEFVEALNELQVNVITLTPSVLNICHPQDFPALTKVVSAGETCMLSTAVKWTERSHQAPSSVRFFNAYGPTETTVGAAMYEFRPEDYPDACCQELSIGTAMEGVVVYLLDDFMKPVPPGIVGEIYIGGAGVSGGYIGHAADRNKLRFVPNPFAKKTKGTATSECESLLYKTGDHAVQDKRGRLTFLGRLDNQVKIRGNRVNLCEVEQVMMQHEQVDVAVVVQHRCKTSSEPTLAAFVSPRSVCVDGLKVHLSRLVPAYMFPTYIQKLDAKDFPRSSNGKVDRKALEADESVHGLQLNEHSQQMNEVQQAIAKIWCEILSLGEHFACSMHSLSSFTAFGGNSLHLALLQRMLEDMFDLDISINVITAADTIENFADIISKMKFRLKEDEDDADEESLRMTILQDSLFQLDETDVMQSPDKEYDISAAKQGVFHYENSVGDEFYCRCSRDSCLSERNVETSDNVGNKDFHACICIADSSTCGSEGNMSRLCVAPKRTMHPVNHPEMCADCVHRSSIVQSGDSHRLTFLLSGTTGFLGAFLLHELLKQTDARVLCMVRGMSRDHCMTRVVENLTKYSLWKESYSSRVGVVLCDLVRPKLGVDEDDFQRLCNEVDVVFVNAAKINFNTSYREHRKVNVLSTREFIRLAMSGKRKFLFFVSSLAVFLFPPEAGEGGHPVMKETDMLTDPIFVMGGYGQSKWASDQLVQQALRHLPGGAIFRPGHVTGRSTDGAGPTDDMFARCLVGMRAMGCLPDVDFPFDLLPVDFCSRSIVEIAKKIIDSARTSEVSDSSVISPMPQVYHLFNKDTVPFQKLFANSRLRALPLDEWRRKLKRVKDNPHLVPLTPFFMSKFWERAHCMPSFSTCNTDAVISVETAQLMKPSSELLALYTRNLGIKN